LSHKGYIKRVPLDAYREQRRGGRGVTGVTTRDEDFVEKVFIAATHDTLLFFTSFGRVYAERAFEIPEASRTSGGKAIVNLLELQENEKVAAILSIREFREDQHVFFATERGIVKKTCLADYRNVRARGIIAINIEEGDRLIQVRLTSGSDEVMLATSDGTTIRFPENQVRSTGRGSMGVRGVALDEGNLVRSLDVVNESDTFLIATVNGFGKRTSFTEFRTQRRGGKGIIGIQTTERNGQVVAAHAVHDNDSLMMVTTNGMMVRVPIRDIRVIGRNTQGVRLINLEEGDSLVSVSVIDADETNGNGESASSEHTVNGTEPAQDAAIDGSAADVTDKDNE
jgi:DNA gyrase subunit A